MSITCNKCKSVDNFTTEISGPHLKATCNQCGSFIKFIPRPDSVPTLHFGKYKGKTIESMNSKDEINYLNWLIENNLKLSKSLKDAILNKLNQNTKTINK